jgi:hypothetical protein
MNRYEYIEELATLGRWFARKFSSQDMLVVKRIAEYLKEKR